MSKQLTLSASIAVAGMALFVLATSLGGGDRIASSQASAPLIGMTAAR